MTLDASGQEVISFASALRNASRLGTYADLLVGMFQSGTWRQYATAVGPQRWRAHEFDYFLIACDARYEDIVRVLGWDTVRAVQLAEAMMGPPSTHRRSLADATATWISPTGPSLLAIAQSNGWLHAHRKVPVLKGPPVPNRVRVRIRHGMTLDEQARRSRRAQIPTSRRQILDHVVTEIEARIGDATERRYLIDQLRRRLSTVAKKRQLRRAL